MRKFLGIMAIMLAVLLALAYSPLPSGIVKNGFLVGVACLATGWALLSSSGGKA